MIENNPILYKYILIDTNVRASYARLGGAMLSKYESQEKNKAFKMNRVAKKYILEKDWK
jgi:hypothetical protein